MCWYLRWGLWEVIKFKWDHMGWALMTGLVPLKGNEGTRAPSLSTLWGYNKKTYLCKPGRRLCFRTVSLMWTSPTSGLWEKSGCYLSYSICGVFLIATWTKTQFNPIQALTAWFPNLALHVGWITSGKPLCLSVTLFLHGYYQYLQ